MIDYSRFAFPKSRVKALEVADKRAAIDTQDRQENAKAKARAGGRCEVILDGVRCRRKGIDPHHLIGGIGRRNKGKSILAAHKLWVCRACHEGIGAKVLQPTTDTDEAAKIRYRRAK
jgi:hypothetical protein